MISAKPVWVFILAVSVAAWASMVAPRAARAGSPVLDGAEFTVVNVPPRIGVGAFGSVTVTAHNIGTTTWDPATCALWFYYANPYTFAEGAVALHKSVAPGESDSFSVSLSGGPLEGPLTGFVQMFRDVTFFGEYRKLDLPVRAEDFNMDQNTDNWYGGVVSGTATTEVPAGGGGLCTGVPDDGDNIAGWVSPSNYIPLIDQEVFEIRATASTSQTAVNEIPLLSIIYDNYPALTYGGEQIVIDVADGANGIGRPQGRNTFELWAMPNAAMTQQWRGTLSNGVPGENDNSMFTTKADFGNDMRLVFRLLDVGSAGVNAAIDDGSICLLHLYIKGHYAPAYTYLTPDGNYWGPAITSSNFAAEAFDQMGAGVAEIDSVNNVVNYQLLASGLGSRKTLFPYTAPMIGGVPSSLYPIAWRSDRLIRGTMRLRSNVKGGFEGGDPLDVIGINFDTKTVELVNTHVTLRGTPDYAHFAASPRLTANTAGEAQQYMAFFYTHNKTALPLEIDLAGPYLRMQADFLNFAEIAPEGNGSDPFTLTEINAAEVMEGP